MNNITFSNALRKQLRNPGAYLEQAGNVLSGLFKSFNWWVPITTTYTSVAVFFFFMTEDLSVYSQVDLQEGLRIIVILISGIAALAVIFSNAGRFRNVFSDRARDEIDRFQAIKEKIVIPTCLDYRESVVVLDPMPETRGPRDSEDCDNADDDKFIEPTALEDLQQAISTLTSEHEKMVNFKEGDDLNALLFSNRVGIEWTIRLLQSAQREFIEQLGES